MSFPALSNFRRKIHRLTSFRILLFFFGFFVFVSSCSSPKKSDLRALLPKNTLAFFEINDLSNVVAVLTENRIFQNYSSEKPDVSALKNVQLAVAVTDFEATETALSRQNSNLSFQPKFVVLLETHAWETTAVSVAEKEIGKFAKRIYGENLKFERKQKSGAKFFIWESPEKEKIFSAISGSLIYVSNDERVLDDALATKRGEAESLLQNPEFIAAVSASQKNENLLAQGFVLPAGIKRLADFAGIRLAVESSDSGALQSFIAGAVPMILQNSVEKISWFSEIQNGKISDSYFVSLKKETASILSQTLAPAEKSGELKDFFPSEASVVTKYNLQNPQIAWRSLVFVAAKNADETSAKYILQFANGLLASYGIADGEVFLQSIDSEILTAKFGADDESSIVVARVKDLAKTKASIAENFDFRAKPEKIFNAEIWKNEADETAAAFVGDRLILGETESVFKLLREKSEKTNLAENKNFEKSSVNDSTAFTTGTDFESAIKIASVLGKSKPEAEKISGDYSISTRFVSDGIDRRIVSDFGFFGSILENFISEE